MCEIKIIGEDKEKTVITYDDYAGKDNMGTFRTYILLVIGNDIWHENPTIENTVGLLIVLYYFALTICYRPFLVVCRKEQISFEMFYVFDYTTYGTFSKVMKGRSNPKREEIKKGGVNVHLLVDMHVDTSVFAKINGTKMHGKKFLTHLLPSKAAC